MSVFLFSFISLFLFFPRFIFLFVVFLFLSFLPSQIRGLREYLRETDLVCQDQYVRGRLKKKLPIEFSLVRRTLPEVPPINDSAEREQRYKV